MSEIMCSKWGEFLLLLFCLASCNQDFLINIHLKNVWSNSKMTLGGNLSCSVCVIVILSLIYVATLLLLKEKEQSKHFRFNEYVK